MPIQSLIPPGGFSNQVGHYVAALDVGLEHVKEGAARTAEAGDGARAVGVLQAVGELEQAWVHEAVGGVPTPPAPEGDGDLGAWIGWLEAVRTITVMVLRPMQDRDLERVVRVPGAGDDPRTLKRLLSELLFLQGTRAGLLEADAS